MNKKLFVSATALTVVTVAGLVYYRHQILAKVDQLLHTRVQGPEEKTETAYVDGRPLQLSKTFADELEHSLQHPETWVTREHPQRKSEESNE